MKIWSTSRFAFHLIWVPILHFLCAAQDDIMEYKYGLLNVRAYYNAQSSLLVLDGTEPSWFITPETFLMNYCSVVGAKNIIPLDANGLSDPFVIVEIVPVVLFAACKTVKTKVVSKSLNPVFEETFQLCDVFWRTHPVFLWTMFQFNEPKAKFARLVALCCDGPWFPGEQRPCRGSISLPERGSRLLVFQWEERLVEVIHSTLDAPRLKW